MVTYIDAEEAGEAISFQGDWCSMSDLTVNTTPGGGTSGQALMVEGSYFSAIRIANERSDANFVYHNTGVACHFSNCTVPADNHDSYNALDGTQEKAIYIGNHMIGGGLLGYSVNGDHSIMVANIFDGTGAATFGFLAGAGAANTTVVGNNSHDVLSTDFWDQAGTGTFASNETS